MKGNKFLCFGGFVLVSGLLLLVVGAAVTLHFSCFLVVRVPAREALAIANIKTINEAEVLYSSELPHKGFTADLQSLVLNDGVGESLLKNSVLAGGRMGGYKLTYTPMEKLKGAIRSYTITAVPEHYMKGARYFYSDESGEIHYNNDGPAAPCCSNTLRSQNDPGLEPHFL